MSHYLLDTNHISPIVTASHPLRVKIISLIQRDVQFSIAMPSLTELLFGIATLPRARQNLTEWQILSFAFNYFDIGRPDAEYAAELQTSLRRQGWQLGTIDALIAAVALRFDLILLTTDNDFRQIPGLQTENWIATLKDSIN